MSFLHPVVRWSLPLDAAPRGLSLAREADRLLIWTDNNWIFWTNRNGERQAQAHLPSPIAAAAVSEDGSAFVIAEIDGRVSWLASDLRQRWEKRLPAKPTALAVDPLGLVAAIGTNQSRIEFHFADEEPAREAATPRPAQCLQFVPGTSTLIACADMGWVGAFDLEIGEWLWRDAPVTTIGGLAVAGAGEPVLLACYSEGLRGYQKNGQPWKSPAAAGCRNVVISYDGALIVTAQVDGTLNGHRADDAAGFAYHSDASPMAMALAAVGDMLYLAQTDRKIVALSLPA